MSEAIPRITEALSGTKPSMLKLTVASAKAVVEIETLQAKVQLLERSLTRMYDLHSDMMGEISHGASAFTAETLREMNEAPIEAAKILRELHT